MREATLIEALILLAPFAVSQTTVTAIQTIAVAALVFLGQYVVAKMSNKAQAKNTDVDSQSKATEAWQKYAEEMKERVDSIESRLNEAERRVRALESQSVRDLDLLRRMLHRFRHFMHTLRDLGHHDHVTEDDEELADLAHVRVSADPLPPSKE